MRKAIFIVVSTLIVASFAAGQSKGLSKPGSGKPSSPVQTRSMDERMNAFAKIMNLKPDQKSKVRTILEKQMLKQKTLAKETKLTPDQRRTKIEALLKDTNSQIRKVLDKTQQKKFDDLLKQAEDRRKRMGAQRPPIRP